MSLLYPNIAQTALQLFSAQKLDIGTFLRADYQIMTHDAAGQLDPLYRHYIPPGIIVLIVFAVGLPIMFFYVLWRVRNQLEVCLWSMKIHARLAWLVTPCQALPGPRCLGIQDALSGLHPNTASASQDPTVKAQFGYLYSGYRLPFWEITEMARKLVMAAVPVFIQVQTIGSLQAVVGEILLVLFMVLTIYLHPYESKHDNWMQVSSIIGVPPSYCD